MLRTVNRRKLTLLMAMALGVYAFQEAATLFAPRLLSVAAAQDDEKQPNGGGGEAAPAPEKAAPAPAEGGAE